MHQPNEREETLFEAALCVPEEKRAAWLIRACGDDAALRQRLEARLEQHRPDSPSPLRVTAFFRRFNAWARHRRRTADLLDPAAVKASAEPGNPMPEDSARSLEPLQGSVTAAPESPTAVLEPITEGAGTVIGRYRILEQIGEGGFGVVYAAEQREPVKRRVALKIIKLGMDTKQVVARFEAERQALALMDHPNIAKVLDAGATDTGRPFFVMELVRGIRITEYCDKNNLPTRQRLDLFMQVCRAIQHAHQKGIIHRDIKPSNILVTLQEDGTPTPKVIDFGIAKATQGQLTGKTVYTELQQFIGTPAYMSPEQAEMMAVDIDTRSDIYSLGVLLYELLTGKTPFDSKRLLAAGLEEIRRIIREEEPPRPSTRISKLEASEQTTVAKRRQSEPPKLIHLVRGDLDWIVMKALEKDRTRRYETANSLASDVRRHLANETIMARRPTTWERASKWTKRHPAAATLTGVISTASLACAVLALVASRQALLARRHAAQAALARNQAEAAATQEAQERKRTEQALHEAQRSSYEANVFAADTFVNANEITEARRRLDACEPSLRNWEWKHLNFKCDSSRFTIDAGSGLCGFALSPDGKWIARAIDDVVKVWSAENGELCWRTNGVADPSCIAFSDDARLLAAGSLGMGGPVRVVVWRLAPPEEIASFEFPKGEAATRLVFDHQAKSLFVGTRQATSTAADLSGASLGGKGQVRICNLAQPESVEVLGGHDDVIEFLGLSADGKKLLTASSRATKVCDLNTRQWETLRSKGQPEKYAVVPKTHDILRLAKGPKGSEISDVFSGEVLCRFEKLLEFQHWAINADATRVVTSWGNVIEAWDLGRRNLLGKYRGHADVIDYLAFASDGLRIASADLRQLKVWNLELPGPISRLLPTDPGYSYRFGIRGASFGLQPETAIAADSAGVFRLWDIQAGSVAWEVATRGDILGFAMASSQGRMGLIKEEVIQIWDVPARKLLHTIRPMARPLRSLSGNPISFSPDASELVAVLSGTVEFWNTATWTLRTNLLRRAVSSAVFSPDTTLVAVAGVGLDLLDARSLQSIARLNKEDFMTLVEFDPAGRQIATAVGSDVLVYDVRTRSLKGRLQGHERITALAFSPDGTRLVSGVGDATIRIWDAVNLNIILTLRGHTGLVTSLAFAPNGQKLLSASLDGSLMLWNTRPLNWEFGGGTNRLGPESRNALRQSH